MFCITIIITKIKSEVELFLARTVINRLKERNIFDCEVMDHLGKRSMRENGNITRKVFPKKSIGKERRR